MTTETKRARFSPEMRSAYIERFDGAPAATTFYLARTYSDSVLYENRDDLVQVTKFGLLRHFFRTRYDIVEIPEPLWLKMWPLTLLVAIVIFLRSVGSTRIVTYAIENADPADLFGLVPLSNRWIRILPLWLATVPSLMLYDRIAFGTEGSLGTYLASTPRPFRATLLRRSRVIAPLPERCACMSEVATNKRGAAFVGSLEARKGVPLLMDAWRALETVDGHQLSLAGDGPLRLEIEAHADQDPSVKVLGSLSRDQVHELLRSSRAIVLLSQPEGRWREQIGLSLLEGIAHDCIVVSTDQTGIASWLQAHGHIVVPFDAPVKEFSKAISDALKVDFTPPLDSWSIPNGRVAAERWLMA